MPPTTTRKRGTRTSSSTTKSQGLDPKSAQIVAQGLLQAVINQGYRPEDWGRLSLHAVRLHANLTKRLMGTERKPLPVYKGD